MAMPKPILIEFCIYYRLDSCDKLHLLKLSGLPCIRRVNSERGGDNMQADSGNKFLTWTPATHT